MSKQLTNISQTEINLFELILKIKRKEITESSEIIKSILDLFDNPTGSDKMALASFLKETQNRFPDIIIIQNLYKKLMELYQDPIDINNSELNKKPFESINDLHTLDKNSKEDLRINYSKDDLCDKLCVNYTSYSERIPKFVSQNDVVLTLGLSKSTMSFLINDYTKDLNLTIFIPERCPSNDGYKLRDSLRCEYKDCYRIVIIPDSNIFSIMPMVNKVVIPAQCIFDCGTVMSYSLAHPVCLAANYYKKPVLVLYWELKVSFDKVFIKNSENYVFSDPQEVLPQSLNVKHNIVAINPECDYIPQHLIQAMISENSDHTPNDSYIVGKKFKLDLF